MSTFQLLSSVKITHSFYGMVPELRSHDARERAGWYAQPYQYVPGYGTQLYYRSTIKRKKDQRELFNIIIMCFSLYHNQVLSLLEC